MTGVRVVSEGPARPLSSALAGVIPTVDGDNLDWDDGGNAGGAVGATAYRSQWKQPVVAATTANITIATALNSGDTLDGVTLADGDRVLVKDQTADEENGIYVVGGTPTRASDMDSDSEVLGAIVYVIAGTTNTGTAWKITNTSATIVDTDSITWAAFGAGGSVSYATPAIVLGTAAAGGAASTVIRSDATIAAFDATAPVTQALGDSAATGSAAVAARRDHKHAMPTAAVTTSGLTQATGKMLGRSTASTGAIEEITVGTGLSLSGGSLTATGSGLSNSVAVGSVDGNGSADFTTTSTTAADVTGASITMTTGARRVKLGFQCVWAGSNNTQSYLLAFEVDGTVQGAGAFFYRVQSPQANVNNSAAMTFMTAALSAGSHTFKVKAWLTGVATMTIRNTTAGAVWHFWAEECPT